MLKISDFSKLARISIRMLRFYDEQDILKPKEIKENGYRYYDVKQLKLALQINQFRYFDFSTVEIKEMLCLLDKEQDIAPYLLKKQKELAQEKEEIQGKLESLVKTIERLNEEEIVMNYHVEVKETPRRFMVCKRGVIPCYEQEGALWQAMCVDLERLAQPIENTIDGVSMAVFHDEGYKEKDVDIEICMEVKPKDYPTVAGVSFKWLEPIKVASITFHGGYENIKHVSLQMAQWLEENKCEMAGPTFCVYHVGYANSTNPEEFVTEICYPIK